MNSKIEQIFLLKSELFPAFKAKNAANAEQRGKRKHLLVHLVPALNFILNQSIDQNVSWKAVWLISAEGLEQKKSSAVVEDHLHVKTLLAVVFSRAHVSNEQIKLTLIWMLCDNYPVKLSYEQQIPLFLSPLLLRFQPGGRENI